MKPTSAPSRRSSTSAKPTSESQQFTGVGDDIIDVQPQATPRIITFTCETCTGWAELKTDSDGRLALRSGPYSGRYIFDLNGGNTTAIEVRADGQWSMLIEDYQVLRENPRTSGVGDDVHFLPEGAKRAKVSHNGSSIFLGLAFSNYGVDNVVNEIGPIPARCYCRLPALSRLPRTVNGAFLRIDSDCADCIGAFADGPQVAGCRL